MINTLSQLQINKFPEYVKLWTEKGLTIKPKSLENAIIDFSLFQKNILKKVRVFLSVNANAAKKIPSGTSGTM